MTGMISYFASAFRVQLRLHGKVCHKAYEDERITQGASS